LPGCRFLVVGVAQAAFPNFLAPRLSMTTGRQARKRTCFGDLERRGFAEPSIQAGPAGHQGHVGGLLLPPRKMNSQACIIRMPGDGTFTCFEPGRRATLRGPWGLREVPVGAIGSCSGQQLRPGAKKTHQRKKFIKTRVRLLSNSSRLGFFSQGRGKQKNASSAIPWDSGGTRWEWDCSLRVAI